MTDNEQQHELYDLSEEGKAEWWPVCVIRFRYANRVTRWDYFVYVLDDDATEIALQHALDLVRAEAERWRAERGWEITRGTSGVVCWGYAADYSVITKSSLAEAIKYEMENNQ